MPFFLVPEVCAHPLCERETVSNCAPLIPATEVGESHWLLSCVLVSPTSTPYTHADTLAHTHAALSHPPSSRPQLGICEIFSTVAIKCLTMSKQPSNCHKKYGSRGNCERSPAAEPRSACLVRKAVRPLRHSA